MTSVRTISILTTTTLALLAAPAFAAGNDEHDAHHPAAAAEQRVAQAPQAAQGMGMGNTIAAPSGSAAAPAGYAEQMKAMQAMHDKMLAAKTPEERNALMAEQMKLMQDGMTMMGRMGGGMGMGGGGGGPRRGGGGGGASFPRQALTITLKNTSAESVAVRVQEVVSILGNFVPFPEKATLAPGESVTLEAMRGSLANLDELELTIGLAAGADRDRQTFILRRE